MDIVLHIICVSYTGLKKKKALEDIAYTPLPPSLKLCFISLPLTAYPPEYSSKFKSVKKSGE